MYKNYWDQKVQNEGALKGSFEIKGNIPTAFKQALRDIQKEDHTGTNRVQHKEQHSLKGHPRSPDMGNKESKPTGDAVNMGGSSNPLFHPGTVFPRVFGFLLHPENNPNLQYLVKSFKTDYVEKKLWINVYDTVDGLAFDWMFNPGETITQTMLGGSGEKLYKTEFKYLKLVGHRIAYDYAESGIPVHELTFTFEKLHRAKC